MSITFYDYKEAIQYAKQKKDEGYTTDICGGYKHGEYIVKITGKVKKDIPRKFFTESIESKKEELFKSEAWQYKSTTAIYNKLERSGIPKARTFGDIENIAFKIMKEEGTKPIGITVSASAFRDDPMAEAMLTWTKVRHTDKREPIMITLHPIHYYTSNEELESSIKHEIEHIKKGYMK